MNESNLLAKFLVAIAATLIATGIIALLSKRRLYLVLPKLFSFSELTDKGSIVEFTIVNHGFKTEEKIEVQLNPSCSYSLVASTDGATVLTKNKIMLERLSGGDEATAIVLAEGKEFSREDVVSISSKEKKGKLVKKMEDMLPSSRNILFFVIGFGLFFSAIFSFPHLVRYFTSDPERTEKHASLAAEGWSVTDRYYENGFSKFYSKDELPVSISRLTRKGDIVTMEITIKNKSAQICRVDGKLVSPVESKDSYQDSWFHDLVTFPGNTKTKTLKAFLPISYQPQLLFVEFNFWVDDDLIKFRKNVHLQPPQAER